MQKNKIGIIFFSIFLIISCQAENMQEGLIGKWVSIDPYLGVFEFFENQRLIIEESDIVYTANYTLESNSILIKLDDENQEIRMNYEIQDENNLILSLEDNSEKIVAKKVQNDVLLYGKWLLKLEDIRRGELILDDIYWLYEFDENNNFILEIFTREGFIIEGKYYTGIDGMLFTYPLPTDVFKYEIQNNRLILRKPNDNSISMIFERIKDDKITSLNGRFYLVNYKGSLNSIEFVNDAIVKLYYDSTRRATIVGEYLINDSNLIITAIGNTIHLEIIGDSVLKDNAPEGGVFIK
jgi:hypothetical protein